MEISDYNMSMLSKYEKTEIKIIEERMSLTSNNSGNIPQVTSSGIGSNSTESLIEKMNEATSIELKELELEPKDEVKLLLIQKLLEKFTGKKFDFFVFRISQGNSEEKTNKNETYNKNGSIQGALENRWNFNYSYQETNYERESLNFKTEGIVRTSDGREISFSLNMLMDREFMSHHSINISSGNQEFIDPLVINFDKPYAELSTDKIEFDLNFNGEKELIPFPSVGSGFLVIDRNNDGKIYNGKDLFGPRTGNGFKELAKHDEDGNNWIDKNDSVYNSLYIWTREENGKDHLISLKDAGIGAIFLGNINTSFSLNDSQNNPLGMMRKSSIFLNKNGTPGTIHHIDLKV